MKPGDKAIYIGPLLEWRPYITFCILWMITVWMLIGCAARKPAIRPGHDRPPKHQAEWACYAGKPDDPNSWWGDPTPVGIFAWKYFRLQWPFGVRCYDLSKQGVKPKQEKRP